MNTQRDIRLEEIYIPSKHNKDTYLCEDFIIYPDGKEKHGGFVFGIIEIRATQLEESEKIIKVIVNTLKEKYYNQISTSPDPTKLNLETVFEYALQKTNEILTELIQISHINFPIENLNYVIAVAKPEPTSKDIDFYFTQQGLINVSLLHKTKQNNYKLINIVENAPKSQEDNNSLKFFSSTLSGKIYYHDAIFISTEIFNNYIPPHKVNKILSTNDLTTAIDYFKTLINNVKNNSYLTYASIFVKMEEKRTTDTTPISQKSMDDLISTKEKTEKFLTPTFTLNIRDTFFSLIKRLKPNKKNKSLAGIKQQKKVKFGFLKYIFNAIMIGIISIGAFFKSIFKTFSNKKDLTAVKQKVFTLNKINKTIIIAVIVLIAILVSSIFWIQHRKEVKLELEAYTQKIQTIQNNINDAQVNLIYKNEAKSLDLIKKAEDDVTYLPQATSNQKSNYQELLTQISNIKNKLLHIEKLVPQLLTEVSINSEPIVLKGLKTTGSDFLAFGENNAIFKISGQTVSSPVYSDKGDIYWGATDERSIFITNQNKALEYKDDSLTSLSSAWAENQAISGLQLYGNRLYILDSAQQSVFKYQGSETGFGAAQSWIKDKKDANLTAAVDLAIDGNIYTLNPDGKINKFYNGVLEDFSQAPTEPALTAASKLYTTTDLNNLYILEGKRIVVFNKDGQFITQYLFETLQAPIFDFVVTGQDAKITLISANKVYSVDIK